MKQVALGRGVLLLTGLGLDAMEGLRCEEEIDRKIGEEKWYGMIWQGMGWDGMGWHGCIGDLVVVV